MNQLVTSAIILARTDYGEADRILTLLTPEQGKLRLLAKGVRRVKSKLAGGIELFSVSTITYIKGRSGLGTLVSTRLVKHYGTIVQDLDRTMLGYELIKQFNRITEDEVEPEYFGLLQEAFEALNEPMVPIPLVRLWFTAQLLRLGGHMPNLQTDTGGAKLEAAETYNFSLDAMSFSRPAGKAGRFGTDEIKFLRLVFAGNKPQLLAQVQQSGEFAAVWLPVVQAMAQQAHP